MSAAIKSSARLKNKRRPGDPWISKNRVLNGGTGKSKRNCPIYRNPNFDTDETKLLIQLWGDPKVQRELITTHKKHVVISQLSAKMEEYGYYRSPEEITTRIKNMKCFYNRLKKELESNKGMDPSWRHYAEMDAIMTRPIFSVRPNEVPAPSLKYLLEQEKEKRIERKRKAEEDGSSVSESDDDISDILAVSSAASNTSTATAKENANKETDGADGGESCTEIEFEADENSCNKDEPSKEKRRKSSAEENAQNKNEMTEAELAIKLEIESEQFQEYQSIEEETDTTNKTANNKKTDETIKTINITEDDDLLVPKMEPIDVDEVYEKQGQQNTPAPPAKQNFTQLADILKQPAKSQNITVPQPTMIKFSMPNNSNSSTTISSVSSSSTGTTSKISVVSPTILMPPLMSAKSNMATKTVDQRQVRLPGNLHALLAASGSRTTVTNANGMKFLLVNAADQRGPPITTSNLTSTIPLTGPNRPNTANQTGVKIIQNATQLQQQPQQQISSPQLQQQQFQQKPQQQQHIQQQQQQIPQKTQPLQQPQQSLLKPREIPKRSDARPEYREQLKKRDLLGIKTTLLKMLKVQEDANEIQNERLAIERERLQFERSLADRFLNIFEQNQKIQQQMQQQLQQQQLMLQQQQSQHQHIQIQQRPTTATSQVFATNTGNQTTAVTPNGQIMLPPKLLITTMVPTSAAQAATGSSTSKVLTTTGFANLSPATSSDIQLVVPKEEPQN
ncbi:myb-like protein P [Lucilia cuprina]|uniref:myb-like protein P n=1 Tax=Lucilia cuprina TaxID=7375 RepID=UPI001F06C55A|nr:myb-like protein P [Lucilia cuprina]